MSYTTKNKLIIEAFKLFASKPYDQVTFSDLEKATGLSRGAILYHIKTKENLFIEVINYFIFQITSAKSVKLTEKISLKEFLQAYINECMKEVKNMENIGITNINLAQLNIESQAFYFYPEMKNESYKWIEEQYTVWERVIKYAISINEIKSTFESRDIASLFINQYMGISYTGIVREYGIDLERLNKNFFMIYQMLKK